MIKGEDAVETRGLCIVGGHERVVGLISKRRQHDAEFHAPSKATNVAPMAPERSPNIDVVTVMAGRAS